MERSKGVEGGEVKKCYSEGSKQQETLLKQVILLTWAVPEIISVFFLYSRLFYGVWSSEVF